MSKTILFKMDNIGVTIRKLREEKKLPLRTVAAYLGIDQAILSKLERGQRKLTRDLVVKLAAYYKVEENDLLLVWLSDKLVYEVADEQMALKALQMADDKIVYQNFNQTITDRQEEQIRIKKLIQRYFQSQNLVSKAWLFGSYARGDYSASSDIDILIDVPAERKFTLFDIAEVKVQLQKMLNKKVDVVMLNGVMFGVKERINKEMQLIYEA